MAMANKIVTKTSRQGINASKLHKNHRKLQSKEEKDLSRALHTARKLL